MIRTAICSGYFNPLHAGHIRYFSDARAGADGLIVIVNNDIQQIAKKGMVIMTENDRLYIISQIQDVTMAFLSIDEDRTVCNTLRRIAKIFPNDQLIFCNGGDRNSEAESPESAVCKELGIMQRFGVGGTEKYDSSSRITGATHGISNHQR